MTEKLIDRYDFDNIVEPVDCDIFEANEWLSYIKDGQYNEHDGTAYWLARMPNLCGYALLGVDGFSERPETATHVAWFAK